MPHSSLDFIAADLQMNQPAIQSIVEDDLIKQKIELSVLRLDQIHPFVSGNKLFKLFYFLQEAKNSTHKRIITFGGAYSNHLAATAFACKKINLKCIGIVRGEKPEILSPTLLSCLENGMELSFVTREVYKHKNDRSFIENITKIYGEHTLIPEGGFSVKGARGAELISNYLKGQNYTHICTAVGTATTFAGIINSNKTNSKIIGFSVLKSLNDIDDRLNYLGVKKENDYTFIPDYHFGGYAKKTEELIRFMNAFYHQHNIPLDFVYTGKLMYGIYDLLKTNYFPKDSKIIMIHTGGLQGNNSLKKGTLHF